MGYRYGNVTSKSYSCVNFEQFIDHIYQMGLGSPWISSCLRPLSYYKDWDGEKERDGIRYYTGLGEKIYFGEEVFLGKQYSHFGEERKEYDWGVYKLVGLSWEEKYPNENWPYDFLVLEDRNGKQIEVRIKSVLLTKRSIQIGQCENGFWYPLYVKEQWPELVEDTRHMKNKVSPYKQQEKYPFSEWRFKFNWGLAVVVTTLITFVCYSSMLKWTFTGEDVVFNFVLATVFASPLLFMCFLVILMAICDIKNMNYYKEKLRDSEKESKIKNKKEGNNHDRKRRTQKSNRKEYSKNARRKTKAAV